MPAPSPHETLHLGDTFNADLELITSATGILGVRGSGKTTSAGVVVEEATLVGVPAVIIDPTGAWFGLKSSANGKSPGLPVFIFGGEHADVPLEPDSGAILGRFIVEKRVPAVLDVSLMRKGQQVRFVADFCETVYHHNREPLLVVIDETARFCPQSARGTMSPEVGRCIGAVDDIVALGRRRGLGAVLIGQRAARINKDVLTQCQTLIAHQVSSPQDRKAINEWVEEQHGSDERAREFMKSLTTLPVGTAFVWSPTVLKVFEKVQIRNRWTFDSSATPAVGKKVSLPQIVADVDLSSLTAELAELQERAAYDDPKALRARIAELENRKPEVEERWLSPEPVFTDEQSELLKLSVALFEKIADEIVALPKRWEQTVERFREVLQGLAPIYTRAVEVSGRETIADAVEIYENIQTFEQPKDRTDTFAARARANGSLTPGARRMLISLGRRQPARLSRRELGTLSGVKHTGGSFGTYLSRLRVGGYIQEHGRDEIQITPRGFELVRTELPTRPQTRTEIIEQWRDKLQPGAQRMLAILCKTPEGAKIPKDELGRRADVDPNGGSFGTYLSRLRTLGFVETAGGLVGLGKLLIEAKP